jgi:ATPase subunit of ABC transporter with duplicated ATPase domains
MSAAIVCSDLSFSWPGGSPLLTGLNVTIGPGRTGLIGVNGSGKSTLLRLIAGELSPRSGSVSASGEVGYLPQTVALDVRPSVSDLLGITEARDALRAIEGGDLDPAAYAAVGDDWDIEERARAVLGGLGLPHLDLDSPVAALSGGETVLARLAALFLRRPAVLLLDEPTNNLDLNARRRLYAAVRSWTGVLVIVSHDRELLEMTDQIAELSGVGLRMYGGNLRAYEEQVAAEQEAAERAVTVAEADVARQRRDLIGTHVKLARRQRYGKKMYENKREPKVVMQERKRQAQVSAARLRDLHEDRLDAARDRLTSAPQKIRDDAQIRIELPETVVPAGRTVLTMTGLTGTRWCPGRPASAPADAGAAEISQAALDELIVRGPERIALTGPNGAGKTTLLRAIAGQADLDGVTVRVGTRGVGYLPQRLDVLDDSLTVVDNVRAAAPGASVNQVRANLARFLFRGQRAGQLAGTLSGGERFRAVLAALLLAEPPPQLLLLDEPTNNLDMASVRQLALALDAYQGALLLASHDLPFLRSVTITRWLRLDRDSGLTAIEPLRS